MLIWIRRAAAIAATIALPMGSLVLCAGWDATPEARMACCTEEAGCPMHGSDGDHSAHHPVSQAQADSCCAGAERKHSTPTVAAFVQVAALTPLAATVVAPPTLALQNWRALLPHPVSEVPKHLLLSILLV